MQASELSKSQGNSEASAKIAVVIPCYRVREHIESVIKLIGQEVSAIYVVDDACPEKSGQHVQDTVTDTRVRVLFHSENQGVGGATLTGMSKAESEGADVIIKLDGDGQMDPALIPSFVRTIMNGDADYAKGNRFFELEGLAGMPLGRLVGNAGLSFLAKISSGYWTLFDPTNGYLAIHASIVRLLPHDKIAKRYFFESDVLFRLSILAARVVDIPMYSHYGDEVSGMKPGREILRFGKAHLRNFVKRIFYNYFVRGFSIASVELVFGAALLTFGVAYGLVNWGGNAPATAGTVMVAALPVILGCQFLLAFLNFDIQSVPRVALHTRLRGSAQLLRAQKQHQLTSKAANIPPEPREIGSI